MNVEEFKAYCASKRTQELTEATERLRAAQAREEAYWDEFDRLISERGIGTGRGRRFNVGRRTEPT